MSTKVRKPTSIRLVPMQDPEKVRVSGINAINEVLIKLQAKNMLSVGYIMPEIENIVFEITSSIRNYYKTALKEKHKLIVDLTNNGNSKSWMVSHETSFSVGERGRQARRKRTVDEKEKQSSEKDESWRNSTTEKWKKKDVKVNRTNCLLPNIKKSNSIRKAENIPDKDVLLKKMFDSPVKDRNRRDLRSFDIRDNPSKESSYDGRGNG